MRDREGFGGVCHAEDQPQNTKVGLARLDLLFLELCCFVPHLMLSAG